MVYLCNIAIQQADRDKKISFPVGLAYIARSLTIKNIPFEILDLAPTKPKDREETFRRYLAEKPGGIFGFGLIIGNNCMEITNQYAKIVKDASPDNIVVYGGPLATAIPEFLLKYSLCDYAVTGEGEERFTNLVEGISQGSLQSNIEGVFSKESIGSRKSKRILKLKNIDQFSPPYYDAFDMKFYVDYYKEHDLCFEVMASRGCYGSCSFCYKFIGSGYHSRSADSLINELSYIDEHFGFKKFSFLEENLLQNRGMMFELIRTMNEKELDYKFRCSSRIDDINEDIASVLSDANMISVSFGFESVNQATLDKMNKRIKVVDHERKIKILQDKGIEVRGSFIIGFPEDTEEDYDAMYDFIVRNNIKGKINFLAPLIETKLFQQLRERMRITDDWEYVKKLDSLALYNEMVVNLTALPDDVLHHHHQKLAKASHSYYEISEKYKTFFS